MYGSMKVKFVMVVMDNYCNKNESLGHFRTMQGLLVEDDQMRGSQSSPKYRSHLKDSRHQNPQILCATKQNLVSMVTWQPGFVHVWIRIEQYLGSDPLRVRCTQALRQALCAPYSVPGYGSPVPLAKFQMAPTPSSLISSGSKKKEPTYICLSEAKTSHSHKICIEVSFSVHFLQVGLLLSLITCRCLLKVLCPVSRPITALVCVLLKDNNRAPVARLGPQINSQGCLCVPQGPRHNARCCFSIPRRLDQTQKCC